MLSFHDPSGSCIISARHWQGVEALNSCWSSAKAAWRDSQECREGLVWEANTLITHFTMRLPFRLASSLVPSLAAFVSIHSFITLIKQVALCGHLCTVYADYITVSWFCTAKNSVFFSCSCSYKLLQHMLIVLSLLHMPMQSKEKPC
jgi:hypothetical protein